MHIYCDFDDVIFHTRKFNYDFREVFVDCGVSITLFDQTYDEARERPGIKCYSYKRHLEILKSEYDIDVAVIEKRMHAFAMNLYEYVFEDSNVFCRELRERGHDFFLVTFGSPELQSRKVDGGRVRRYAKDAIIGEIDKEDAIRMLQEKHGVAHGVFIDDREEHIHAVKEAFPEVVTILMCRPEGRYHDKPTGFVDYTAESCADAMVIIKKLEK